jgi:hypothetical protein
MAVLNVVANVVANPHPIISNSTIGLVVSVMDGHGQPVLEMSEAQFEVAFGFQKPFSSPASYEDVPAQIAYSSATPALNPDGTQVMETGFMFLNGQEILVQVPKFIPTPGPARMFGLPGNYLLRLNPPSTPQYFGWRPGRAVLEVAVSHRHDHGHASAAFDCVAP